MKCKLCYRYKKAPIGTVNAVKCDSLKAAEDRYETIQNDVAKAYVKIFDGSYWQVYRVLKPEGNDNGTD